MTAEGITRNFHSHTICRACLASFLLLIVLRNNSTGRGGDASFHFHQTDMISPFLLSFKSRMDSCTVAVSSAHRSTLPLIKSFRAGTEEGHDDDNFSRYMRMLYAWEWQREADTWVRCGLPAHAWSLAGYIEKEAYGATSFSLLPSMPPPSPP